MSYATLRSKIEQLIEKAQSGGGSGVFFGENLADQNEIVPNKYLSNGNETAYNSWDISSYIPVTYGKYYSIAPAQFYFSIQYSGAYDENKQFLRIIPKNNFTVVGNIAVFTPSENERYLRFSEDSKAVKQLVVCEVINGQGT